jgi:hypothetical protein
MPRRKTEDANEAAFRVMRESTGTVSVSAEDQEKAIISRIMREMGSRGGKKGGTARAKNMTPEQLSNAASLAARARWEKQKKA